LSGASLSFILSGTRVQRVGPNHQGDLMRAGFTAGSACGRL